MNELFNSSISLENKVKKGWVKKLALKKQKGKIQEEDVLILSALEKIKEDLDNIYKSLDVVTDPVLIDSFIYEMNALNMRYKFYLEMCKKRGIISTSAINFR